MEEKVNNVKLRTITSENDVDILKEDILRDGEGGGGSEAI